MNRVSHGIETFALVLVAGRDTYANRITHCEWITTTKRVLRKKTRTASYCHRRYFADCSLPTHERTACVSLTNIFVIPQCEAWASTSIAQKKPQNVKDHQGKPTKKATYARTLLLLLHLLPAKYRSTPHAALALLRYRPIY